MSDLAIVSETADDAVAIERLHERTFGPGRYAKSAYRLREGADHLPDLSFTARIGTLLVGSVRLSPVRIGTGADGAPGVWSGPNAPPEGADAPGPPPVAPPADAAPCQSDGSGPAGAGWGP